MGKKVFEGIKVADFSWLVVGPYSSRYLADHGATVVKIESHKRFDFLRVNSPFVGEKPSLDNGMWFGKYNANRYSVTLDLGQPRGVDLAWKFINWADIIIDSYRPGIMKKLGLDYESVSKIRPDIIYLSTSLQGQWGPFASYAGMGSMTAVIAGFGEIIGWPDRGASQPYGAYSDYFCPRFNATALIAALDYRRRTGKGQWLDQSHLEICLHFLSPLIMDYMVNKRIAGRNGNRVPDAAPHGVFPCKGNDRWIAIAVFNDVQWETFCGTLGKEAWAKKQEFATLSARKENEDMLDKLVGEWTSEFTAEQLETLLQEKGIAAGAVAKSSDLFDDPQLKHRKFFVRLSHPVMGTPAYSQQVSYILSKTPREISKPSPCIGEHNEYVYKNFLKMTDEEIASHIIDGSITTEIPEGTRLTPGN